MDSAYSWGSGRGCARVLCDLGCRGVGGGWFVFWRSRPDLRGKNIVNRATCSSGFLEAGVRVWARVRFQVFGLCLGSGGHSRQPIGCRGRQTVSRASCSSVLLQAGVRVRPGVPISGCRPFHAAGQVPWESDG
jgi:hypothetical protein